MTGRQTGWSTRTKTDSRRNGAVGRSLLLLAVLLVGGLLFGSSPAAAYDIGVFYFPGWLTGSAFWKDLQGLPGSRSPGIPWPEREPLLGFNYPEQETWVAEKEIDWASSHGITFFAFDWYWLGKNPDTEHAEQAFLRAKNRDKLKFCLLWANHSAVPRTMQEFDDMVSYWIDHYFKEPNYYRINNMPVIFLFSYTHLDRTNIGFQKSVKVLLNRARATAKAKGYKGIYFIATTNEMPDNSLEKRMVGYGFDAYTAWNYSRSKDGSRVADYNSMVDTYLDFYNAAAKTAKLLPYIVPASPGFDDRPWYGDKATVRTDPTPEKFEKMLIGAKKHLDSRQGTPKILMIEAWNEYAEGSYIAPTKKWGVKYLETIRKVFLQ